MKLWHKYAIALFLTALLPLGVAAWQIAGRGAAEVMDSAKAYHMAVADSALASVRALLEGAYAEMRSVGSAVARVSLPADERLRDAQAALVGAKLLENFVVYTPDGGDVQHMTGANRKAKAVAGEVAAPTPLPEALRARAKQDGIAFGDILRRDDGALFLPLVVQITKSDGSLYAFGWSAVDLTALSEAVTQLSLRRFGDEHLITIVDSSLRVVASADEDRRMQPFVQRSADLGVDGPEAFKRDMARTFSYTTTAGESRFGALAPITDVGWGIVVEQPMDEVFAAVSRIWQTTLIVGGAFALLALVVGVLAGRRLSAPIAALSRAAGKVAAGDFAVQVAVPGKDEVGHLATSFNAMAQQLTSTIAELQATTAAKERMQTELDIGRKIQMSMVPLAFPAYPERKEFDVHAALKPAYEVGGDFYDFFLIDENTLCVCIADVAGKGVPAALFMAVTRTMVKAHASAGATSDTILDLVNADLAKDNDACMFVTMFLGLLDLRTGELAFTNAGHCPSYVRRAAGGAVRLQDLHGPAVAIMEDVPYGKGKAKLERGDTLLLYTDGISEAMNAKRELFTEERLAKLLAGARWTSAHAAVDLILEDVWRFQGDAEQADDVTVVALRYLGV